MFETLDLVLGTTEMRHPSTQEEEEGRPEVRRLGYMWRYATFNTSTRKAEAGGL